MWLPGEVSSGTTVKEQTATFQIQRSKDRYFADHGWLRSFHSFSFADYYDPMNQNWGALRVFNDDYIAAGQGFPTHPHRDMEIVTYVLRGELEHKDSMGNHGVVHAGGIQYMSAGSGVQHSEFNASKTDELHLVQMWVMPATLGAAPGYGQEEFPTEARTDRWLTVASGRASDTTAVRLRQDAALHVARITPGRPLDYSFANGRYGFLFVAEGSVAIDGETLGAGDAVRMHVSSSSPQGERLNILGEGELVLWNVPAL